VLGELVVVLRRYGELDIDEVDIPQNREGMHYEE
jgi:hypothetical protein